MQKYEECLNLLQQYETDEFKTFLRAKIQMQCFRFSLAADLLDQCHMMNRNKLAYLKAIAKNYFLLGKYKSSLEVAKDAYRLDSTDGEIFFIMGKISLALNDKKGAMNNFSHSLLKAPNESAYIYIAQLYMQEENYLQASDYLIKCTEFAPQNVLAYEMLGKISAKKFNKLSQAKQKFKEAIKRDPFSYQSFLGLAALSISAQQIQTALSELTEAFSIRPNSAALWNDLGVVMYGKNKVISAYSCFRLALYLDPFRWDIHSNLALILIQKQKYLPAIIHLKAALRSKQDCVLFNLLGVCLTNLVDYSNAEKAFQEGLKIQPSHQESKFNLLACIISSGDKAKAQTYYQQIIVQIKNQIILQNLKQLKSLIS